LAETGEPEALYDLGLAYATGHGVGVDLVSAHKWFNLAAMSGVKKALAERAELAREMSANEIAEAQRLARAWRLNH
jgi:TPR repeat protein